MLPPISAKRQKGGYLVDPNGVPLPSVTTILNATKPPEAWEALARWRDRLGAEEAQRVSRAASRRGSLTHKHIKDYLLGKEVSCPDFARPYWDSLKPVLDEVDSVQLVESAVFHYDLAYAGKVDCVASFQGTPCICDWKTSDRPKGSVERLHDGPLQLAAYCGAVNHAYATAGIHLRHALLVVAIPDQPAELFWFEPEQVLLYWQQWQGRVEDYYRFRRRSPISRS